jgi:hypothetical protein
MTAYIDLPDQHYGIVAFLWTTMFSEKKGFLTSYKPVQIGHYYWQELVNASVDRAILCPTLAHQTFMSSTHEEWQIDTDEIAFVPDEAISAWVSKNRAYLVSDIGTQKDELDMLVSHYTTPESH